MLELLPFLIFIIATSFLVWKFIRMVRILIFKRRLKKVSKHALFRALHQHRLTKKGQEFIFDEVTRRDNEKNV